MKINMNRNRKRQEQPAVRISDEEYARLENKFETLRNEFSACKRKLDSKCEALLILSQELDQCRSERDQFKLMAEQLRERCQNMKKKASGLPVSNLTEAAVNQHPDKQVQHLSRLLCESRDNNKSLQLELEDLKQKHHDAQGDIKLLREQIARQRVGTTDEGMTTRHFPAHEREELVQRLETSKEQYLQLERDLQTVLDEKEELVLERDVYKTKYERLNQELNYILKGDENRVVDIDALVMENRYLQERLKQMEEEKSMAMAAVSKYKSLLEKKKNKSCMKLGQSRAGSMIVTQKQVQQVLEAKGSMMATPQAMSDLQALAAALLDTVNDKNLALSHQRKTNKILGCRVSELEKKIKTLEVAGLWSVPGNVSASLEKLKQDYDDVKTMIPRQLSETSELTPSESSQNSELEHVTPLDSLETTPESSPIHTTGPLALEDLDLLPTKEISIRADLELSLNPTMVTQDPHLEDFTPTNAPHQSILSHSESVRADIRYAGGDSTNQIHLDPIDHVTHDNTVEIHNTEDTEDNIHVYDVDKVSETEDLHNDDDLDEDNVDDFYANKDVDVGCHGDDYGADNDSDDAKTSEKMGLLMESMAKKMCNISRKTSQSEYADSLEDETVDETECHDEMILTHRRVVELVNTPPTSPSAKSPLLNCRRDSLEEHSNTDECPRNIEC